MPRVHGREYTATELFRLEYGDGKNFMTPRVLGRGKLDSATAWELSTGTGLEGEPIYGVTVVEHRGGDRTRRATERSSCFRSRAAAQAHIDAGCPELDQ